MRGSIYPSQGIDPWCAISCNPPLPSRFQRNSNEHSPVSLEDTSSVSRTSECHLAPLTGLRVYLPRMSLSSVCRVNRHGHARPIYIRRSYAHASIAGARYVCRAVYGFVKSGIASPTKRQRAGIHKKVLYSVHVLVCKWLLALYHNDERCCRLCDMT